MKSDQRVLGAPERVGWLVHSHGLRFKRWRVKNGFLVKAFDEDEYVEKLSLLMSDKEKRDVMAEKAIASVERFDYKYIADKWIDLFERL